MKRVCCVLLASALLVSLARIGILPARADVSGDFIYTVSNSQATVTGYTGTAVDVTIPDTLGGYTVTAIGDAAFQSKSTIGSVRFGAGVKTIGENAFRWCSAMTKVSLDKVETIGAAAFYGCIKL